MSSELSERSGARDAPDVVVDDEENYTHARRQQIIEDCRAHAIDIRTEARGQQIVGQISDRDQRRYYRGAVEAFVLQVIPVLTQLDEDNSGFAQSYLDDVELGEVVFKPPEDLRRFAESNIQRLTPGASVPTRTSVPVRGLRSIVEFPSPLSRTFSVSLHDGGRIRSESRVVEEELPRGVLDSAMEMCDRALATADIGLKLGKADEEAEFDYSDLLEQEPEQ